MSQEMMETLYPVQRDPFEDVHHPEPECVKRKELKESGDFIRDVVPVPRRTPEERTLEIDPKNQTLQVFESGNFRIMGRCRVCFDIWLRRTNG